MTTIERQSALAVEPLIEDYATADIEEAFDWNDIVEQARRVRGIGEAALYLVVFKSHLKPDADVEELLERDAVAHEAALESTALLEYHGGKPNAAGFALSFCLWTDQEEARAISRDPRHAAAMKMVSEYQSWSIERYTVHHADGDARLEPIPAPAAA